MDQIQLKLLSNFSRELGITLNLRYLFPHLTDRKLLTSEEEQQLRKLFDGEDGQVGADQEQNANVAFLKILKTKGSKAFELFLQAIKDEKKHLGHNDLYETLSQQDKRSRQESRTLRSASSSSIFEPGANEHVQPISDTLIASDSSAGYSSVATTTDSHWEYRDIKQRLSQIEKAIGENSAEVARLNKELRVSYSKIMAAITRPSSSASGEGDDSSGSSEPSLRQKSLQSRQKSVKKGVLITSESEVSLHSAQEEEETKPETINMVLSQTQQLPKIPMKPWPISLVSNPVEPSLQGTNSQSYSDIGQNFHSHKLPNLSSSSLVSSRASSMFSLQQVLEIAVPCTCQRSNFPPVFLNNHAYFLCWIAKDHQRTNHSISFIEEYIQAFSLLKGCCVWSRNISNIQRCICSVFAYANEITLFGGEFHNKNYKVALYQLSDDKSHSFSWRSIPMNSKKTLMNLDPNNCVCLQHRKRVIVATIVSSKHHKVYFHVYFPEAMDEYYWKSASLQIQHPQKLKHFSCDLQSCVMLNENVYYTVWLNKNMTCVYQVDLSTLFIDTDSQQHAASLHLANLWPIDDPTMSKCFLSVFDNKVIRISAKCIDNKNLIEVNSVESFLQQTCVYQFPTDVEVTSAAVVPDTINNLAIVYHETKTNSCYMKILRIV